MSTMSTSKASKLKSLAVAVVAVAGLAAVAIPSVGAADLDYGPAAGRPYDDPRYSDIYRHPPPPPRYAAPYAPPPPPVYRQEHYGPPPHGYDRHEGRAAGGCAPQEVIRARLERRGWGDFHDPQVEGAIVHLRARRPSGRLFDLTIDRCTGEVLGAEAIEQRAAQGPLPPMDWRWRQPRTYGY
jgi:hypothetical protein